MDYGIHSVVILMSHDTQVVGAICTDDTVYSESGICSWHSQIQSLNQQSCTFNFYSECHSFSQLHMYNEVRNVPNTKEWR